jgi:hypothetical protein
MAMPLALPPPVTSSGHLDAWLDGQRILTQHEAVPAPPRCVAEGGALKEHVRPALAPHEARVRSLFSASGHFVGEVTEVGAGAGALQPGARVWGVSAREQQIGGSGGSLEPPGLLLTHLHTVYMAYSERLPTRLNPLAERTCFSQVGALAELHTVAAAALRPLPAGLPKSCGMRHRPRSTRSGGARWG